ncbi:hypothetical protein B0H10DRAFT_1799016 [Mycena sp. CBHHK59/15]|nr:hypothetical protein B0H10DRAFT_1799016 [Mycena sp. CBHHK59/15]
MVHELTPSAAANGSVPNWVFLDGTPLLNGPPTSEFKADNLRPEVEYITTWPSSGLNNQVIEFMNLIYLALITERVPIISDFTPLHVGHNAPVISFGEVFDVPRLQKELGPIFEWRQVKDPQSDSVDNLGCWNVRKAVQTKDKALPPPRHLKLDVSYTMPPSWIKLFPDKGDYHASFWSLASLSFPDTLASVPKTPSISPIHKLSLPPDEHLLCYDNLYFVSVHYAFELEHDVSPAWRFVGRHMHWAPKVQEVADSYIRQAFGIDSTESIPPYIAIHVRHGDFSSQCKDVTLEDCYAPLSVISRRVEEVKEEIWSSKGITIDHVIMTSDEKNTTWWEAVHEVGWASPDHSRTVELYGEWYPVLIDAAIQSAGLGFIGTLRSTVSLTAQLRVSTWQGGVVRTVRWGWPGADDH